MAAVVGCTAGYFGCAGAFLGSGALVSGGIAIGCLAGPLGCIIGGVGGAAVAAFACGMAIGTCMQGGTTLVGNIGQSLFCGEVIKSCDPNDIIGPVGYGELQFVSINDEMHYTIRFENDSAFASAAAQRVEIRETLSENVNPFSFRLGDFGFGQYHFSVPNNASAYVDRIDLPDSLGFDLDVTAGLNIATNEVFWIFQSVDPATGLPPPTFRLTHGCPIFLPLI